MNTPTPRTDAAIWPYMTFDGAELVPVDLARTLERELATEREKVRALRLACERLRDCDWVISLPDRMDAVRDIARAALAATENKP